jgi:hypothetical protein
MVNFFDLFWIVYCAALQAREAGSQDAVAWAESYGGKRGYLVTTAKYGWFSEEE